MQFTLTSGFWLNLVERWFAEITQTRLRRGSFENRLAQLCAIRDHLEH